VKLHSWFNGPTPSKGEVIEEFSKRKEASEIEIAKERAKKNLLKQVNK